MSLLVYIRGIPPYKNSIINNKMQCLQVDQQVALNCLAGIRDTAGPNWEEEYDKYKSEMIDQFHPVVGTRSCPILISSESKESFGSSPSLPVVDGCPPSPSLTVSNGSEDSEKSDTDETMTDVEEDTNTIKSSQHSVRSEPCSSVNPFLEEQPTVNFPGLQLQRTTFGRRILESLDPSFNLGPSQSIVTPLQTGKKFGSELNQGISRRSLRIYEWCLTARSELLELILPSLSLLNESATPSSGELRLGSHDKPGWKQGPMLFLNVLSRSSGMGIKVNRMLLLMNFEEKSVSRTCLDGLIVIHSTWIQKGVHGPPK